MDSDEGDNGEDDDELEMDGSDGAGEIEGEVDEERELSDSELVDYGYEPESSDEEDGNREAGVEDDITVGELGPLGFAEY
jgi:hypothetical protein